MQRLANRYELLECLGSGGSASVWRARDTALDVERAIKLLEVHVGPERGAQRERLRMEASAMARLSHPGIVSVHDVGVEGDADFIVMDLIAGPSLATHLQSDGPMTLEQVVRLGVQVLAALQAAHDGGIVHRDVKPGNILLDPAGDAQLCDFGIALHELDERRHTRTGTALGSLPYMSPEQRRDAHGVHATTDLYGLGCTLYEALTMATPVDLYLAPGQSPRWSAVPAPMVAVLRRATAADPSDRYADAKSMASALVRVLGPVEVAPLSMPIVDEPTVTRSRGYGALWVGLGLFLLLMSVAGVAVGELQRLADQAANPTVAEDGKPPALVGVWQGTWQGEPGARLVLRGVPAEFEGELVIRLGEHERRTVVTGAWRQSVEMLVLKDRSDAPGNGSYEATLDLDGVLRGDFRRVGEADVSFALVRTE